MKNYYFYLKKNKDIIKEKLHNNFSLSWQDIYLGKDYKEVI